jgi:hypothetical protein
VGAHRARRGSPRAAAARRLRTGSGPASLPVAWESAAPATLLGLRVDRPVRLLAIDSDRGAVPPGWCRHGRPTGSGWRILRRCCCAEAASSTSRARSGASPWRSNRRRPQVDIGWLDQHETVHLSPQPAARNTVTLALPPVHRGWALLPPSRNRPGRDPVGRAGRVHACARSAFTARGGRRWSSGAGFGGRASAAGTVELPGLRPLKPRSPRRSGSSSGRS